MIEILVGVAGLLIAFGGLMLIFAMMITEPLVAIPSVAVLVVLFWLAVTRVRWVRMVCVAGKGILIACFAKPSGPPTTKRPTYYSVPPGHPPPVDPRDRLDRSDEAPQ